MAAPFAASSDAASRLPGSRRIPTRFRTWESDENRTKDVHGILLRVASLEDTLKGTLKVWSAPERRHSKRIKDLADIARLLEAHPGLRNELPVNLKEQLQKPLFRP